MKASKTAHVSPISSKSFCDPSIYLPLTPIKLCINTYLARDEGAQIINAVALIYN